jgi:outer membrane lipopolysaccharide assembly protein LptE/RlpB
LIGQTFRLVSIQPRNELTAALIQQLTLEGAIINDNDTNYVVNLGLENFQQRNLSLTAQARSAEVELTMTTEISLREGDQFLIEPAAAMVVRQFLNDPRNVVGKTEELRLLREEMRQELAAQIVRRMSYSISADAN